MLRRGHSRSFVEKHQIPHTLPPLQKKNTNIDDNHPKIPCSTRPTFVIRKKISSFADTLTTRKACQGIQNLQNSKPKGKGNPDYEHDEKPLQLDCSKQMRKVFKKKDINKEETVSICKIQLPQEHILNENILPRKNQRESSCQNDFFDNTSTIKSIVKKGKKRKIDQCKIRKISWGSSKNGIFDLGLSAIKQNQDQTSQPPIDSLQQLYAQIQ